MRILLAAALSLALGAAFLRAQPAPPPASASPAQPQPNPPAAKGEDRYVGLFTPFRTDRAALSPDGRYLAYSLRQDDRVSVVIVDIDHPQKASAVVTVATDDTSTPMQQDNQVEKTPARIRWMRWTTPTRLAIDTNGAFGIGEGTGWVTHVGAVFAVDADGKNGRLIATPRDVLEQVPDASTLVPPEARDTHTIWTPDQPLPSNAPASSAESTSSSLYDDPALQPTTAPAAERSTIVLAQDLSVFDLAPGKPGCVLLQTFGTTRDSGARRVGFILLDTITGKMTDLAGDVVPSGMVGLNDRAGHVRLTLPSTLLTAFPHEYSYLGPTGANMPRSLDKVAGAGSAFSLSPADFFGVRDIPLGFGADPNVLYFASNQGRNTFGVYGLNLSTGTRGPVALEDPDFDLVPPLQSFGRRDELVIDRFHGGLAGVRYDGALGTTKWVYPSFQAVESRIESALRGHSVRILEWDEQARRFLVLADSPGDAGAYYIFDRSTGALSEFVRRAPWIDANQTHKSYAFSLKSSDGLPIPGLMTVPDHPHVTPMPVVILCPNEPWARISPDFQSEVQALADMGFLVVQYSGRGAWGYGLRLRQALFKGYDLAEVDDLMATLDYVEANYSVDRRRVAVFGRNQGGFIALRALQMHPDRFRCAVAINAPIDIGNWLDTQHWTDQQVGPALTRAALGDKARLAEAPLARHPESIRKPVFLLHYPGPDGAERTADYLAVRSFAGDVRSRGGDAEVYDLSTDYMRGLPRALSETFAQIEGFLNVTVYDYGVKMGPAKERR